jgi:hypothetical protein
MALYFLAGVGRRASVSTSLPGPICTGVPIQRFCVGPVQTELERSSNGRVLIVSIGFSRELPVVSQFELWVAPLAFARLQCLARGTRLCVLFQLHRQ